jgi:hypothetical protein
MKRERPGARSSCRHSLSEGESLVLCYTFAPSPTLSLT